jgi:FkbM family methyltransferase
MNKRKVKRVLRKILPSKIFRKLFSRNVIPFERRFVVIEDQIAKSRFEVFLREDSMIEHRINEHGLYNEWEKESLKIWAQLSKISTTIIDIGANTGIYSLIAINNNPKAKVIAIEPVNLNFEVLSKNIERNRFAIYPEQIALSDKEGKARMFMLKDRLNYMTSINDNRYELHPEIQGDEDVVEIEVAIKPFSYVAEKHQLDKIDLIKIDVEGHEITVLNSMIDYINRSRPAILIEIIGDDNAKKLNQIFEELEYQFISIDETNKSNQVTQLWDNDHHNFLVCRPEIVSYLRERDLID